jgi:hypothetical protein
MRYVWECWRPWVQSVAESFGVSPRCRRGAPRSRRPCGRRGATNAVYAISQGSGNTGATIYAKNSSTTGANSGVYGVTQSSNSNALGTAGIYASGTGAGEGMYAENDSTGSAAGIYSIALAHGNTGYAGYFTNIGTGAINYGLYASTSSSTGWWIFQRQYLHHNPVVRQKHEKGHRGSRYRGRAR